MRKLINLLLGTSFLLCLVGCKENHSSGLAIETCSQPSGQLSISGPPSVDEGSCVLFSLLMSPPPDAFTIDSADEGLGFYFDAQCSRAVPQKQAVAWPATQTAFPFYVKATNPKYTPLYLGQPFSHNFGVVAEGQVAGRILPAYMVLYNDPSPPSVTVVAPLLVPYGSCVPVQISRDDATQSLQLTLKTDFSWLESVNYDENSSCPTKSVILLPLGIDVYFFEDNQCSQTSNTIDLAEGQSTTTIYVKGDGSGQNVSVISGATLNYIAEPE